MNQPNQNSATESSGQVPRLHQVFAGDQIAVREALNATLGFLKTLGIPKEACGPVEIVLAEAVNNVIEHAYEDAKNGPIDLTVVYKDGLLFFTLTDNGLPMPGETAPAGLPQDLDCPTIDLPEGGFGWFLIRELTQELTYMRQNNRNLLAFSMDPYRDCKAQ